MPANPATATKQPGAAPTEEICRPIERIIDPAVGGYLDLLRLCRVAVFIPPDALDRPMRVRLTPHLPTDAPVGTGSPQLRSVVAKLEVLSGDSHALPGFVFSLPYTVTMRYLPGDLEVVGDGGELSIARYDEGALLFRATPWWVISEERRIEAGFDRPGWLALVAKGGSGEKAGAAGAGQTGLGTTPIPMPRPTGRPAEATGGGAAGLPIMVVVAFAGAMALLWLASRGRGETSPRRRQRRMK